MGGAGAKERRRLQRNVQEETEVQKQKKRGDGKIKLKPKQNASPTAQPGRKKFKKPKHLKRKLECLEDNTEKQAIKERLEKYEKKKSELSWQNPQGLRFHENKRKTSNGQGNNNRGKSRSPAPLHKQKDSTPVPTKVFDLGDSNPTAEKGSSDERKDATTKPIPIENVDRDESKPPVEQPSSDDESQQPKPKRQRGNRRRGRKDTSTIVEATKQEVEAAMESSKKTDTRYCKGRKPVTDFIVGSSYPGKVVYSKPFGVFIDIGCHSDSFCHVSRCQDEYVESAEDLFNPGDEVTVRVLEIEKGRKRITVSMQSENRRSDENRSIDARKQRRDRATTPKQFAGHKVEAPKKRMITHLKVSEDHKEQADQNQPPASSTPVKDEADMTPAELKRARKLARRAARRDAKDTIVGDVEA